jgi:hypothetical protein
MKGNFLHLAFRSPSSEGVARSDGVAVFGIAIFFIAF